MHLQLKKIGFQYTENIKKIIHTHTFLLNFGTCCEGKTLKGTNAISWFSVGLLVLYRTAITISFFSFDSHKSDLMLA